MTTPQWGATADTGGTPIGDQTHDTQWWTLSVTAGAPVDTQCDRPPSTSGGHSQVNGHPRRRTRLVNGDTHTTGGTPGTQGHKKEPGSIPL